MKENYNDFCYIWWCFDKKHQVTVNINKNLEEMLKNIKHFFYDYDKITELKSKEFYEDYMYKIQKIKYYGNINNIVRSNLYMLRYPNNIYDNEELALKDGLRFYFNYLKDRVTEQHFNIFKNNINKDFKEPLNLKDLEEMWKIRIDGNIWCNPNHVTCNKCKRTLNDKFHISDYSIIENCKIICSKCYEPVS